MSKYRYLVALDGSEWSERAAQQAVNLAEKTGAIVKFVTVIPWSGYAPLSQEEIAFRPLEKHEEERIAKDDILGPVIDKYKDRNVTLETAYHWGHPVEALRDVVKKDHIHMVFVGRRGRSRIVDLLLGSVANSLAHSIGVPIVLVP
jgi:nucleotide-binding universal stress UspA family protein